MSGNRRNFQRPLGKQHYKKMFIIATEGTLTESLYFEIFNREAIIRIQCLKGKNKSAPLHILKRMERFLQQESLKKTDEAWLVVDKDKWADKHLKELYQWSLKSENYGFALSNPKFEYWLLFHFEEGKGLSGPQDCSERLKTYLPDYDKRINPNVFTQEKIEAAIQRAGQRDNPPCKDWPRTAGTTVYKLVKNILASY